MLLALQAVKRALALDPDSPEAHELVLRFCHAVQQQQQQQQPGQQQPEAQHQVCYRALILLSMCDTPFGKHLYAGPVLIALPPTRSSSWLDTTLLWFFLLSTA